MESRLKLRISRMFRASFGSCRSRDVSDVIERPVFFAQNRRDFHLIEPISPKVRTFPSICKPRCSESMEMPGNDCIVTKEALQRRKVSDRRVCFKSADTEGRTCPPASPISPSKRTKERKKKPKKIKKNHMTKKKKKESYRLNSSSGETNGGWFSSEDESETFFSSKSFSSDSYESHSQNERSSCRRKAVSRNSEISDMGLCSFVTKGKVEESFAVVKRSSDPYSDFRTSMVEMIIEKQIFAAKDLEQLLQCFLSLNSSHHHRVIVEVFTEIWEALFSNWS